MVKGRADRQSESGLVAVSTALMLMALMGFFAIAFNVGVLMETRAQLQNGSDAAALAAARSLNGKADGLGAARVAAFDYSQRHQAYGQAITIDEFGQDLVFGRWHLLGSECLFGSSGHDCFETLSITEPRKISAVKINNGRDGGLTHNPLIPLPFGAIVGASTGSVSSRAIAVGGGAAAVQCSLPLVVAECKIVNPLSNQMNSCVAGTTQRMTFANSGVDAVGFINMYYPGDTQAPSGNFVADVINNRLCNPSDYKIGPAKLQNGNDFNKDVIDALRGVGKKGTGTGTCLIATANNQPLQTLAVSDAGCPGNPIFQGVQDVVGFVKATIVAVTDNTGTLLGCPGEPTPVVSGPLAKSSVIVDIPCAAAAGSGDVGGGHAFNAASVPTRLVQ